MKRGYERNLRGVEMLFYRGVRYFLAAVFFWSGITKFMDPVSFGVLIDAYGLLPKTWVMPVAMLLSSLEVIAGAGLILDIYGSLAIVTGMVILFIAILSYGIHIGLDIDCGCFGYQDPEAKAFHGLRTALYRDFLLMAGILYLYAWRFYRAIRLDRLKDYFTRFTTQRLFHTFHHTKGDEIRMKKMFGNFLIGILIMGLATFAHAFGKDKFEEELEKEQGAIKLAREIQRGGYDIVSTEELKKMLDEKKDILVIDTMPFEDSYKKEHVPGAKQFLFPIPDMLTWDTKETGGKTIDDYRAMLGPDTEKTVVIYCGFVKCTRSHNGAVWARRIGYKNVLRYPGGIFAWKGAKYPVQGVE